MFLLFTKCLSWNSDLPTKVSYELYAIISQCITLPRWTYLTDQSINVSSVLLECAQTLQISLSCQLERRQVSYKPCKWFPASIHDISTAVSSSDLSLLCFPSLRHKIMKHWYCQRSFPLQVSCNLNTTLTPQFYNVLLPIFKAITWKRKWSCGLVPLNLLFLGAFPDAFKFQENLKKLRKMVQEPTLRELLKTCINPDVGCSKVFKTVVCSFIVSEYATYCVTCFIGSKDWDSSLSQNKKCKQSQ